MFMMIQRQRTVRVSLLEQRLVNLSMCRRWWRMPQVAEFIARHYGSLAETTLLGQRVVFVADFDLAKKLMCLHGNSFLQRFGSECGLDIMGMHRCGLIWNNNLENWKSSRDSFEKTVNRSMKILQIKAPQYLESLESTGDLDLCKPISILLIMR
jgi:hypothetical protein